MLSECNTVLLFKRKRLICCMILFVLYVDKYSVELAFLEKIPDHPVSTH